MTEIRQNEYEVYLLDMYLYDDDWVENERIYLGSVKIDRVFEEDPDEKDVLSAISRFTYRDIEGLRHSALLASDRKNVDVDDYYGDGTWWEICLKENNMPVYGLKLKEDETNGQG